MVMHSPTGRVMKPGCDNSDVSKGFSLVEVSLALLVVGVGLLTVFSLFPAGLKQGEAGHEDTQTALFSDYVISTLRANVATLDANAWDNLISNPSGFINGSLWNELDPLEVGSIESVEFPTVVNDLYVRYVLDLDVINPGEILAVSLYVAAGEFGTSDVNIFRAAADLYYTEFVYSGMP